MRLFAISGNRLSISDQGSGGDDLQLQGPAVRTWGIVPQRAAVSAARRSWGFWDNV